MSLKDLDDKIKKGNISGIYLLYGEEEFDLNRYLEKMKSTFGTLEIGVNFFVLDKTNVGTLADICAAVSFLGASKFVVVKNSGLNFDTKMLDEIDIEDVTIVFAEPSVDKRTTGYKYLTKKACVCEFVKLDEKNAVMYVISTLGKYKVKISQSASEYMVSCCGTDKTNLINELKKIVAYLKPEDEVTTEIIDKICVKTLNAKVFDMADLAVAKKHKEALSKLRDLISQKESPIGISIILFKQIKQMYMIKLLESELNKNNRNTNIAEELGIHPFVYRKLSVASQKYKLEELENLIKEFDEYDEGIKSGEMDAEKGIIRLVMLM